MRSIYSKILNFCLTSSAIGLLASCSVKEAELPTPPAASKSSSLVGDWVPLSGKAVEIAAGEQGKAWVLGTSIGGPNGYEVYESSGNGWAYVPSPGAARIYRPGTGGGGATNEPWIIGNDGVAYRRSAGVWTDLGNIPDYGVKRPLPFPIMDMAYEKDPANPDTQLFVLERDATTSGDHQLWRREVPTGTWTNMGIAFKKIVFDFNYQRLIGIKANTEIMTLDLNNAGAGWILNLGGLAVDIAQNLNQPGIQPSRSSIMILGVAQSASGQGFEIFSTSGPLTATWAWAAEPDGAIRVAVGQNGAAWIIKNDNSIWKGQL